MQKEDHSQEIQIINNNAAFRMLDPDANLVAELRKQFSDITITDVHDSEQIGIVKQAIREVKAKIAEVRKTERAIVSTWTKFRRELGDNAGTIIDGATELLSQLEKTLNDALEEVANEKAAAERQAMEFFNARCESLFAAGYAFNGVVYTAGTVQISPEQIKSLDDDDFNDYVQRGAAEKERIEKMLAAAREMEKNKPVPHPTPESPPPSVDRPEEKAEIAGGIPFDEKVEIDWNAPEEQKDDPADYRPPGYMMGWEAHKNKVLSILNAPEKMTRAGLREKILALKP